MSATVAEAPLFSVVVPVYNVEAYVGACLDSIEAQTWRDFEAVLVDDGSTDGSGAALEAFCAGTGVRTKLARQANKGLYLARNTGLRVAEGRYVVCVDSDDVLAPDALARIAEAVAATDADIVAFESSRARDFSAAVEVELEPGRVYAGAEARRALLAGTVRNALFTKAFRRELVTPVAEADEGAWLGFCLAEDLAYSVRMFDGCRSMAFVDEPLYFYRPNDASISRRASARQLADLDRACAVLMEHARCWAGETPDAVELAREKCCYMAFNYAETLCMGNGRAEAMELLGQLRESACFEAASTDFDMARLSRADMRRALALLARGDCEGVRRAFLPKRAAAALKRAKAKLAR
jgi:hypothetical protein